MWTQFCLIVTFSISRGTKGTQKARMNNKHVYAQHFIILFFAFALTFLLSRERFERTRHFHISR